VLQLHSFIHNSLIESVATHSWNYIRYSNIYFSSQYIVSSRPFVCMLCLHFVCARTHACVCVYVCVCVRACEREREREFPHPHAFEHISYEYILPNKV
jgi:hypothetical protein